MFIRSPALLLALACAASLPAPRAQAVEPLSMLYYERKPFHYTLPNGKVDGLVVGPTERAFSSIGLSIKWELLPANRILLELERNGTAACSPGWYRKPEREAYARFSAPIYKDRPLVGLVRADARFKQGITARELLARPDTRLLVKRNFSQGAYMDALIAKMPSTQLTSSSMEVATLVKMIHAGRADLIVTTQEEVELYVKQAELEMNDFRVLEFPDVPAIEMRYVLCNQKVPAEVMSRLNAAIGERAASQR